ncbi:MAG: hypothetical protein IJ022_02865, partial [Burkholderiaceae bacterium]|nr:hypothetical protein [Burkholderiaceae bacterium]
YIDKIRKAEFEYCRNDVVYWANNYCVIEDKDSPFVVVVATRKGDEKKDEVQKLVKALKSEETKKYMVDHYKGSVVPLKN